MLRKVGALVRIDVVHDGCLSQHDLPDHVTRLDMVGEDGRDAGAPGWQAPRHFLLVELDANYERRRLNLRWRNCEAAGLGLSGCDRLQHCLHTSCVYRTGEGLECDLDRLPDLDVACLDLRDLDANNSFGCVD